MASELLSATYRERFKFDAVGDGRGVINLVKSNFKWLLHRVHARIDISELVSARSPASGNAVNRITFGNGKVTKPKGLYRVCDPINSYLGEVGCVHG